jgi:hypothetical protein
LKQIFEEGCRQYLQSIGMIGDVASEDALDQIAGIGPTVAAGQAIVRQSDPRSMVGARTKILTYLGLLYAREGQMPCSVCGTMVGGAGGPVCAEPWKPSTRLRPSSTCAKASSGPMPTSRSGGHHIYCVPDRDLVVAIASRRTGRWRDGWPLLTEFVIPSVIG